jgi:hypothetical protein
LRQRCAKQPKSTASFTDRRIGKSVTLNDIQKSFDVIFEIEVRD